MASGLAPSSITTVILVSATTFSSEIQTSLELLVRILRVDSDLTLNLFMTEQDSEDHGLAMKLEFVVLRKVYGQS